MEPFSLAIETRNSKGYQTLSALTASGIRYCIWKSIDRFDEGIHGKTDFDLLIEEVDLARCFAQLKSSGWIQVLAEPWRAYPDVYDFLSWEPAFDGILHLHIHTSLIMGEGRIKSIVLPLNKLYFQNTIKHGEIQYASPELEFVVILIRFGLKFSSRSSLLFGKIFGIKRLFTKGLKEIELVKSRASVGKLKALLESPELAFVDKDLILSCFNDLSSLSQSRFKQLSDCVTQFSRLDQKAHSKLAVNRFIQRRSLGIGKSFPSRGLSVAFIGPDGSGKSAIAKRVMRKLKSHFRTKLFYLGGSNESRELPRVLYRFFIFPPFAIIRRILEHAGKNDSALALKRWFYGYEDLLIAMEKLERYNRACKVIDEGGIALFERFPVFPDFGDVPSEVSKQLFGDALDKIFDQFSKPDLILGFDVSEADAIGRKLDHDSATIKLKVKAFKDYYSRCADDPNFRLIDSYEAVDEKLSHVMNEIFSALVKSQSRSDC